MRWQDHLIDLRDLAGGGSAPRPLGFVDLSSSLESPFEPPPFPLLGVGDPAHPLARRLDAVIETPVTPEAVARSICAKPRAATVAVGLLRAIDGAPVASALVLESLAYGLLQGSEEHAQWRADRVTGSNGPEGRVQVTRENEALDIVLDRPESANAIDRAMRDRLNEAFSLAALDPEIRRVKLSGAGKAFSIGAELGEFGTTRDPASAHAIRMQTLPALPLSRCAEKMEAHVQGACIGAGLEIAAFAGRVTATADAWFHLPELAMGLIPGAGGCVSLSRRIGRQRTALLLLSGKRIGAKTALGWGLVDTIVDDLAGDEGHADIA